MDSRSVCRFCRRVMHIRLDGKLRKHRNEFGRACGGSNQAGRAVRFGEQVAA